LLWVKVPKGILHINSERTKIKKMKFFTKALFGFFILLQAALLKGHNRNILLHRIDLGEMTTTVQVDFDITPISLNNEPIYRETHFADPVMKGYAILKVGSINTLDSLLFIDTLYYVRIWSDRQPHSIFKLNSNSLYQWLSRAVPSYTLFYEENTRPLSDFLSPLPLGPEFKCNNYLFYEGRFYRTTQIGSQCWFAENLNVGTRINNRDESGMRTRQGADCMHIQKYCYNDDERNCDLTGGLYEWAQAMCGATYEMAQGICPDGWHIPSHNEWTILERFICNDAGNSDCEKHFLLAEQEDLPYDYYDAYRGTNEGALLRASYGWGLETPDLDLYGFSALPGRIRWGAGSFRPPGIDAGTHWLSSTHGEMGFRCWGRSIGPSQTKIFRSWGVAINAVSVRCVKDTLPDIPD
jgi:uncharacterized protein (TIGR02145 family)